MVNKHFANDSLISLSVEQGWVDACLDVFCTTSGFVVNDQKTNFWLVGLDSPPD